MPAIIACLSNSWRYGELGGMGKFEMSKSSFGLPVLTAAIALAACNSDTSNDTQATFDYIIAAHVVRTQAKRNRQRFDTQHIGGSVLRSARQYKQCVSLTAS